MRKYLLDNLTRLQKMRSINSIALFAVIDDDFNLKSDGNHLRVIQSVKQKMHNSKYRVIINSSLILKYFKEKARRHGVFVFFRMTYPTV